MFNVKIKKIGLTGNLCTYRKNMQENFNEMQFSKNIFNKTGKNSHTGLLYLKAFFFFENEKDVLYIKKGACVCFFTDLVKNFNFLGGKKIEGGLYDLF